MEFPPFASLSHVRILIVPVGNIKKQAFDKWAKLVRSFETIRLGDIPPDGRDDHGMQLFQLDNFISDVNLQLDSCRRLSLQVTFISVSLLILLPLGTLH